MAVSPDGKYLAAGVYDTGDGPWTRRAPALQVWDLSTGKRAWTFAGPGVRMPYLAFTPDGKRLLSRGQDDSSFLLWDVGTGEEVRRFDFKEEASTPVGPFSSTSTPLGALSPDGKVLMTRAVNPEARRYELKAWDVSSGKLLRTLDGTRMCVNSIDVSRNGKRVLILGMASTDDVSGVKVLTAAKGEVLCSFGRHDKGGWSNVAALSPGGKRLFLDKFDHVSDPGKVSVERVLWGVAEGKAVWTSAVPKAAAKDAALRWAAFSPDGKRVVGSDQAGRLRAWDAKTGKLAWEADGEKGETSKIEGVRRGWAPPSFVAGGKQLVECWWEGAGYNKHSLCCRWYRLATGKVVRNANLTLEW